MSDTTTASPPATAATSTPRQRAAARPTVSLRPVAVGGLNAATIAGATAVAAGGGAVLAVLAGGGVLAATAVGARKKRQGAAQRTSTVRTVRSSSGSAGGGGGMPRLGRSGAGAPGGRAPGSKPSPVPRGAAGRPTGAAKSGGAAGNKPPRLGLFGKRPGGPGGGPAGGGRGAGAGAAGHRRAGSKPGASSRAPLTGDRVAAARRKLAARRQPGPRMSDAVRAATTPSANGKNPTARQAFANARRGVTGDNPKRRGFVRRAVAGLLAGAIAWDKTQRAEWQRRKKAEAARKAKNARVAARQAQRVGTTVRRATDAAGQTDNARKPAPAPVRLQHGPFLGTIVLLHGASCAVCGGPLPAREWVFSTRDRRIVGQCCGHHITADDLPAGAIPANTNINEGTITMTHPLLAISEDFLAAAARNQPEGKLQVVAEAHLLPLVMENIVKAMKIRFDRAQGYAFHESIKEMYGLVHKAQVAVQQAAEEIGPSIEKIHEKELDRLRNPRVGEEMWDVARNRGQV